MANIPIYIMYQGMLLSGFAYPVKTTESLSSFEIFIQGWKLGILTYSDYKWSMDKPIDPNFINALGDYFESFVHKQKEIHH
jgi:hypothetical protein